RELRPSFPVDLLRRAQAIYTFMLVEKLLDSDVGKPVKDVVRALAESLPKFPGYDSFKNVAASVDRFPFLELLPKGEDGRPELAAQKKHAGFVTPRGDVIISEKLARAVAALCLDRRVRYDWTTFDKLYEFISSQLFIKMDDNVW